MFYETDRAFVWPIAIVIGLLAGFAVWLSGFEPPGAIFVGLLATPLGFASGRRKSVHWIRFAAAKSVKNEFDPTIVGRPTLHGPDSEFEHVVSDITARIRSAHRADRSAAGESAANVEL